MRIAILTLPLHTNYGGILQAYALQTVLERMGHKVEVLDKRRREKTDLPLDVKIKRFILKYLLFQKLNQLREDVSYYRHKIENKYTWKFADKHIHRREITSFNDIKENDYDAIVVGSDQVWRPCYFSGNYNDSMSNAFLSFTNGWNIKRITYAASFGNENWEFSDKDTIKCKILINQFNAVSVREQYGKILLCQNLDYNKAVVLPDPTLLLEKQDYINLILPQETSKSSGNLLVYFIDETFEKNNLLKIISTVKNLKAFRVNSKVEDLTNKEIFTQPSVESWIRGFFDAEFVITDSYHACIFSIIFNKEFIVYGNKERGITRFKTLLNTFHLEDRLIEDYSNFNLNNIKSQMPNNDIIKRLKDKGINFLKNNII